MGERHSEAQHALVDSMADRHDRFMDLQQKGFDRQLSQLRWRFGALEWSLLEISMHADPKAALADLMKQLRQGAANG